MANGIIGQVRKALKQLSVIGPRSARSGKNKRDELRALLPDICAAYEAGVPVAEIGRTMRHAGYDVSERTIFRLLEEAPASRSVR